MPDLGLADPVVRLHTAILRASKRMPVRYTPSPALGPTRDGSP
jgi:hypothetical protein